MTASRRPWAVDRRREPQAAAWCAVLATAELPYACALPDVAEHLADLADPQGVIDPAPRIAELAAATGWPRTAAHRAVALLVAGGWLATSADGVTQLTLPNRPDTGGPRQ